MIDVALASCDAYLDLYPDDRLLRAALIDRGLSVTVVSWTNEAYDWTGVRCCLPRNTWDYADRPRDFDDWLGRTHEQTQLWNPIRTLRWNMHKRYLLELEGAGVPTVPTVVFAAKAAVDLAALLDERGWEDAVVKPAFGQTAREAIRFARDDVRRGQTHLDRLLQSEDVLVQPFVRSVLSRGETSIVFLDGSFSHAVQRRPRSGDWRTQDELGGSIEGALVREDEMNAARAALAAAPTAPLYARIDLVRDTGDRACVSELELIEPALFFGWGEGAAERLAGAVFARLARGNG